jgi:hypothetical protein
LQVVTLSNSKRPPEYLHAIEELKKSFVKSIEIVNRLRDLGLKYGLSKVEIRKDIELALDGVVKPRQLRSLLPLELKNTKFANKNKTRPKAAAAAASRAKPLSPPAPAAPLPQPVIEFRGKISRMGNRRIIGVPSYLFEHVERLGTREIKVMIF